MPPMAPARGRPYGRGMSALRTPTALSHTTVGDVMSRGVITCAPETGLIAVAATMAAHGFHAAVLSAPDGGRALVITDLDLIRAALSGRSTRRRRTSRASRSRRSPPSGRLEGRSR